MTESAVRAALTDAAVAYPSIQQAYVGYVYGDSTSGQTALYGLGQTAIPIVRQLRGGAGARQVEGADVALQHNIGLGGAAVVTLYEKVS